MGAKGGQGERRVSASDVDSSSATILHVDMDAFFASVELLDRPDLVGRPVIVGGNGDRGVVTSATYEARRFGVRSAMPVSRALRLCPAAVVLPNRHAEYSKWSRRVMAIFRDVTPIVEPLSIDEAFLDVAGAVRLFGPPGTIAADLRARVRSETGLTCSVGAASTKFVAKLASTSSKPDGLLVVPHDETIPFLHALPVGALWGVGKSTGEALTRRGLRTVRDIAETPRDVLIAWLGEAAGSKLHALAHGRDSRRVTPERVEKSMGHEHTFGSDVRDAAVLNRQLLDQAGQVAVRLRRGGVLARTVSLKLRFADFTTITRSKTLAEPTDVARRIHEEVRGLLVAERIAGRAVRLIGTRAEQLVDAAGESLSLWSDDDEWRSAERTVDQVSSRFGSGAVRPASLVRKAPPGD